MITNINYASPFKYVDIVWGTIGVILSSLLYFYLKSLFGDIKALQNALTLLFPLFIFLLVFFFHKRRSRFSIIPHITNKKHFWASVFLCLALGIGINSYEWMVTRPTLKPLEIDTLRILLTQVVVCSYEELIFRGLLFLGLYIRSRHIFLSAIISSICFSVIHFQTYSIIEQWYIHLWIVTIGMVLCYLYIIFKSLWAPILLHFSNNVFTDLFNFPDSIVGPPSLTNIIQNLILILVCLGLIFYQYKNRKEHTVEGFLMNT